MRITKFFVLFFVTMSAIVGNVSAAEFKFNHINTRVTACDTSVTDGRAASASQVFYVNDQNRSEAVWDEYWSNTNRLISDRSTQIQLWESDSNLVSGCDSQSAWGRYSEYTPANTWVVATAANCTFNKPTNKNNRNVQFTFQLGTYGIDSGNWSPSLVYASKAQATASTATTVNLSNIALGDFRQHTNECLDIELRYCGDGILEPENGETCDPEDPDQTGFGNGGCDTNTCQPIENPTCESITTNISTGTGPTDVNVACEGFKADSYKIDCGNGQTINSQTGTCNYTTGDTYTPQCFVNDTITSNSCSTEVIITNLDASIAVDKIDANVFDLDGQVGGTGQFADTQSVQAGDDATFRITVTNDGDETLKNIKLIDTVETSCATIAGGVVNLQAGSFVNMKNQTVAISYVGGSGNNSNSTLEPGESFSYTCSKPNTQSDYFNEVKVLGTGINSEKEVTDEDDTKVVLVGTPGISIIKRDANERDKDGNEGGNDSQTVSIGDTAVFHITVTNSGTEDLENIILTDALADACASNGIINLANKSFTNKNNDSVSIAVSGQGNHNDNIFQVKEVFTYTCDKGNTQESYTNIVQVEGTGINSGQTVPAQDTTEVVIDGTPKVQVIKTDLNSNDQDGEQFNDTQTVISGNDAIFQITVKNIGSEDLKDIVLSDPKALACGTKSGTIVNLASGSFTSGSDVIVNTNYLASSTGPHNDDILQVGEEFSYICSEPNTTSGYINEISVAGVGITSGDTATDDDTSAVVLSDKVFDLALRKTLSTSTPGPFQAGDTVTFDITVFNQGTVDATNVIITDYVPTGLTLAAGSSATQTIASITANGGSETVSVSFTIDAGVTGSIVNYAEISGATGGDDCDSTPDSTNENTSGEQTGNIVNDEIGGTCDDTNVGDEDDHDLEEITVEVVGDFDLALRKTLSTSTPGPFQAGDTVTFDITVFNQGTVDATNVEIVDYIPAGLTLLDSNKWLTLDVQDKVGDIGRGMIFQIIPNITAGSSETVSVSFTIDAGVTGSIVNYAEISGATGGDDCDSTPDSTNENTSGEQTGNIVNDEIGGTCDDTNVGDEDDHDLEEIRIGKYDLALIKQRVGTEELTIGSTVNFNIIVTNQGEVDSGEVVITDYIPNELSLVTGNDWDTVGENATQTIVNIEAGKTKILPISFTINEGAKDFITNFAEISSDSGQDCDSTPDATNENTSGETDGTLENDETGGQCDDMNVGDEDDHDLEIIPVADPVFDLALRKTLSENTQAPFVAGDRVIFEITVFNQGNIDATNVVITDYIPDELTIVNSNGWQVVDGRATKNIGTIKGNSQKTETIIFTINDEVTGSVENIAEIASASGGQDCDSTPDTDKTNDGTVVDDAIGTRCDDTDTDEDDHDPETIIVKVARDLELIKSYNGSQTEFVVGDTLTYDITVKNTGTTDLTDLKIEDHYGTELELSDDNWTNDTTNNIATLLVPRLNAGDTEIFSITFIIVQGASGDVRNAAAICAESEPDCDPQPPVSCEDSDEVNNPDGCVLIELEEASIKIDKIDKNPADQDNNLADTQTVNSGAEAVFQITVTNDGNTDLTNIVISDDLGPACAGSVEIPNIRVSSWDNFTVNGNNDNIFQPGESFSYECRVSNTTSNYTNIAVVTADPTDTTLPAVTDSDDSRVVIPGGGGSNPGGPGGGGLVYACEDMKIGFPTAGKITCEGNSKVESFYLNCGGTIIGPRDAITQAGGLPFAEFDCNATVAQCHVLDDDVSAIENQSWRTSNVCRNENIIPVTPGNPNPPVTPPGPVCGNGIIEIGSNPNNPAEQCDLGSNNGPQGANEAYCSNSCKIELPTIDPVACANSGTNTGELCVLTFPNQGQIVFNPGGQKIIGHGTNPIDYGNRPSITNESDYDLVFDQFCIQENGGKSSLLQGPRQCSKPSNYSNGIIYPGETVYFTHTPTFTANKGAIPANADYGETKLSTSLLHDGFDHKNSYFAADMTVRVARPSVATVGGGTSFIKNDTGTTQKVTGDIYDITLGTDLEADENKNFVGTSVNTDTGISSFSETLDNSTDQDSGTKVVETVRDEQEQVKQVETIIDTTTTVLPTGNFDNYNGLSNVFIVEGDKTLTASDLALTTGSRTYIVQDGDLTISTDIISNDNIAFVVRGGDIKIGKDVERLDGTYVSIPDGTIGGNILATAESNKQLQVNGSLYGDIQDLVQKRNYIASDGDQLSVGTVVSFGSGIFSKPAPLVSQFIGEYLESTKVAR